MKTIEVELPGLEVQVRSASVLVGIGQEPNPERAHRIAERVLWERVGAQVQGLGVRARDVEFALLRGSRLEAVAELQAIRDLVSDAIRRLRR